ncbi:DNA polymerase III subunit gamma/tau [uncultured Muribaculum sp.]|uniref:DNA polymerase III subunit gamma/tau n=1 Tax=uncultured Muribaculum sp. TaxID=1918613 RepID=UPI0025E63E19|nr:DNA polymerase III subunit gamma/tau [uncultured Muribaculum sp.]
MENYIVSARKYRPSTFASVVGQKALTATLRNSISKNRLAHAYLFCGSRGVGKTSCARIFAKTINCRHRNAEGEACNECDSCREFNKGASLNIVELDAASNNGIDDMKNIIDQVQVPPVNADYRVFIIDEVHMLSNAAFNAFLKTLEEPPSYVVFILATTEKHKVLPTILSRCQIYDFNRITIQDMVDHLSYVASQEGITAEPAALNVIARKADGAMRDALSIFDQVAASSMGNVTYEATIDNLNILDYEYYNRLIDAFLTGNVVESLLIYKEIRDKGFDSLFFINGLAQHLRDLMVARDPRTAGLIEASDQARASLTETAAKCQPAFLYNAMALCNKADLDYRTASNKQLLVELTLIKLCQSCSPSPHDNGAGEGQLRPIKPVESSARPSEKAPYTPATPPVASDQQAAYGQQRPHAQQPTATVADIPTTGTAHPSKVPAQGPTHLSPMASSRPTAPIHHAKVPPIGGIPGFSITNPKANKKDATTTASAHETVQQRTEKFTDEEFAEAWQEIIDAHPTEQLLTNAMRNARPRRCAENAFVATVESEAIEGSIMSNLGMLLGELRNRLKNDMIQLSIELNKGQATATSLTDAEFYSVLRKKCPYLNTMIQDMHITLM